MPKRKSESSGAPVSLASLDAALDLLACETFTRLSNLTGKFEAAAGVKLNDGVVTSRWEEAVRRYWVMKGMDDLCCSMSKKDEVMEEPQQGRSLPPQCHPGAPVVHHLAAEEEQEWRKWSPKVGDEVLVELADDGIWPGKVGRLAVSCGSQTDNRLLTNESSSKAALSPVAITSSASEYTTRLWLRRLHEPSTTLMQYRHGQISFTTSPYPPEPPTPRLVRLAQRVQSCEQLLVIRYASVRS